MSDKYMHFLDYLIDKKIIDKIHYDNLKNYQDINLMQFLESTGYLENFGIHVHIREEWRQYIKVMECKKNGS